MSESSIIEVAGVGKRYRLGELSATTVREEAQRFWDRIRGRAVEGKSSQEDFWALREVDLTVRRGETVGLIGHNGAGKSTLLKILSRITEPTTGRIALRGRVASLLEVGTGFHPELTGRENTYLNGAILGMSTSEIRSKLDAIVDFAGIEQFLDTPVKRYSSGMYVRLAFSVAAHLEPEILLVDEVLAVGDLAFQRKCLGKMDDVTREGRTVLFVSHNMAAVEHICDRACVVHRGRILFDGPTASAIKHYHDESLRDSTAMPLGERTDRQGSAAVRIESFEIRDDDDCPVAVLQTGRAYRFCFGFSSEVADVSEIDFSFTVRDASNQPLFRNRTVEAGLVPPSPWPRFGTLTCSIPRLPLTEGRYAFAFRLLVDGSESDYLTGGYAAYFDVVDGDYYGNGKTSSHARMMIDHHWSVGERSAACTTELSSGGSDQSQGR